MSREKFGYRFNNELLRELRIDSGKIRQQLADECGVTLKLTQWWENGRTVPEVMRLPLVARAYGCKIDDLFVAVPE
jgi:transcriptional regulator with XRE-family HTH domain